MRCEITRSTLDDHFGGDGTDDVAVFKATVGIILFSATLLRLVMLVFYPPCSCEQAACGQEEMLQL
ncbi:MAG TPA: hypothetical protein VG028_05610 [Terriglobia bacterium]|nr:hypothetical protein [Terriglobia bacterium]